MKNGVEQVVGELRPGDLCGEIGVLCYRPQLFTVRTKRLSQLLRLNRTTFLNIVQNNVGDGAVIMNNLLQVCLSSPTYLQVSNHFCCMINGKSESHFLLFSSESSI